METCRIFSVELEVRIVDRIQAAAAIPDDRGRTERDLLGNVQLRILHGRARGHHGELRESIHHSQPFGVEMPGGVEVAHFRGDPYVQTFCRDAGDRADSGARFHQARPEFFALAADRRNNADAGHNDPVHCAAFDVFAATSFSTISATSPTVENGTSWPPPLLSVVARRVASSAFSGMVMSYFSSRAKTISITSSDSAPSSSRWVSGVSRSTEILSDFAIIDRTSSIIAAGFAAAAC